MPEEFTVLEFERPMAELDAKIEEHERVRASLSHLARECGSGSAGPCPILQAFDHL